MGASGETQDDMIAGTIETDTGDSIEIRTSDVYKSLANKKTSSIGAKAIKYAPAPYGMMRIDVDTSDLVTGEIMLGGYARAKSCTLFFTPEAAGEREPAHGDDEAAAAKVMSSVALFTDPDAITCDYEEWTVDPAQVDLVDDLVDGSARALTGEDLDAPGMTLYWIAKHEGEDVTDYITVRDVFGGVTMAAAITDAANRLLEKAAKKKRTYQRTKDRNAPASAIDRLFITNDPANLAVHEHPRNGKELSARYYFSGETLPVSMGGGGEVTLAIAASEDTDINAPESEYKLSDTTKFYLDAVYTLAFEYGQSEMTGGDILKLLGYTNPWSDDMRETMRQAANEIDKAIRARIMIDATKERRKKAKGKNSGPGQIARSMKFLPVVNGVISIDEYASNRYDFLLELDRPPAESLPLGEFARERGMLVAIRPGEFKFGKMRLTSDDRRMWRYVVKQFRSQNTSNTILLDTMWRNLEIQATTPDGLRKKKQRMLDKLTRMLEIASGRPDPKGKSAPWDHPIFSGYKWKDDGTGFTLFKLRKLKALKASDEGRNK